MGTVEGYPYHGVHLRRGQMNSSASYLFCWSQGVFYATGRRTFWQASRLRCPPGDGWMVLGVDKTNKTKSNKQRNVCTFRDLTCFVSCKDISYSSIQSLYWSRCRQSSSALVYCGGGVLMLHGGRRREVKIYERITEVHSRYRHF